MSDDDELRRRLREIPGPRAGIDADAVLARARRRRRPKVAALAAAATGAGVLIFAPIAVAGISPLLPQGASMVAEDAGAPAPASEQGGAADPGAATESGEGPESAETGGDASIAAACAYPSMEAETGIVAEFADDPADGAVDIRMTFAGSGGSVRVLGVAVAEVAVDGPLQIVSAPDPSAIPEGPNGGSASGSGGGVTTIGRFALPDAPMLDCGVDAASAPAPLLLIEFDGRRLAVVGEPFGVR